MSVEQFVERYGPLFLINLPARRDRRAEFEAELARLGLSFQHPQITLFPAVRPTTAEGFPTLGARGCFLSHKGALEAAMAANCASVIICEDDLDFAADFRDRLPGVMAALERTEWDIFYAGYTSGPVGKSICEDAGLFVLPPEHEVICAHFYIVKGRAIALLCAFLETVLSRPAGHPDGGPMHYDGALNTLRAQNPDLVTLAILPTLGTQRPSATDIHALKWFDRTPVIRSCVAILRRLRR